MLCYLVKEYLYKTVISVRFLIFILVLLLSLYSLFHPMAVRLAENGYTIGALEVLPCISFTPSLASVYFVTFLFLVIVYPMWDGSLNQIARLGKRKWVSLQYVYICITAVLYYLIWTVGFILAFLPCISWRNEWSSFMILATDVKNTETVIELSSNVVFYKPTGLMDILSPLQVWALVFLLQVLGEAFVGILALVFNISYRRGVGTILAFFVSGERQILSGIEYILRKSYFPVSGIKQIRNLFLRAQYYISPLYQSDLLIMAEHNTRPLPERVGIAVIFYLLLISLLILYNRGKIRKIDLAQE